jgi:signal transduction histidine kinase
MKKIVRNTHKTIEKQSQENADSWIVLIVDDEPDVHTVSRLALSRFEFAGKKLRILQALSGEEARQILLKELNIAVAFIDIVMETDDAGLRLVDFIRNELNNQLIRLIIRTGQPGLAPEKSIIEQYDIDDYKEKTELTETKMYTTLRLALKSYQTLKTLKGNRDALAKILDAAPSLYNPQSIKQFFDGILEQIINLCDLGETSFISTMHSGFVATTDNKDKQIVVHAGTGHFADTLWNNEANLIKQSCLDFLLQNKTNSALLSGAPLPEGSILIPLQMDDDSSSFIYLENTQHLIQADKELISIMAYQCAAALKNLHLYLELKAAHHQTTQLLSMAEHARDMAEAANSAKTTFLAKMSHELRTPLNAIIGYSNLIQEEALDNGYQDVLPDLNKIRSAGQQLHSMISDILDISQIESEQMKLYLSQFYLPPLIEELKTLMQPLLMKNQNQFEVNFHGNIDQICSDQQKLKQILLNLLNNANKFTKKGLIQLNVSHHSILFNEQNRKQCKTERESCTKCNSSGYLILKVTDNGIGISEHHLKRIFDTFIQIDETSAVTDGGTKGAGLGLSISQQLCRIMGGKITVASVKGEGSTFTVQLPVNILTEDQI